MAIGSKGRAALWGAGLLGVLLWGWASGDMQTLFSKPDARVMAGRQQKALDHLFGSDQSFDPAADMVTQAAEDGTDTVSWKLLSDTQMRMKDGVPQRVEFSKKVKALDGSDVTISGYMFPLQASGGQEHFLLSAYPPSCPYCLPGGPTELIEVSDSEALPFTYDKITIRGQFGLLGGEELNEGMFYRMSHIRLSK